MGTVYVGSFGHRYGDPIATFVGLSEEAVQTALDNAIEYEASELPAYCEHNDNGLCADDCEVCQGACSLCWPDLVQWGVWPESRPVRDGMMSRTQLFECAGEWRNDRTAVVPLYI